jgi:hypothetical protein
MAWTKTGYFDSITVVARLGSPIASVCCMHVEKSVAYLVAAGLLLGSCGGMNALNEPAAYDAAPDCWDADDLAVSDLAGSEDSVPVPDVAVGGLMWDAPVTPDLPWGEVLAPDVAMESGAVEVGPAQDLAAIDRTPLDGGGDCPDGEVRVTSRNGWFQSFCAQPCSITPDCPSGWACVVGIFDNPQAPVCVSADSSSTSRPSGFDGPPSICWSSTTLGSFFIVPQTRDGQRIGTIEAWSLTTCPNGCEKNPDGGYWPATCR